MSVIWFILDVTTVYYNISISCSTNYDIIAHSFPVRIDPGKSVVYLDDGKEVQFEKCLIATGGSEIKF